MAKLPPRSLLRRSALGLAVVSLALAVAPDERAEAGACARIDDPTVEVVPTVADVLPQGASILVQIVGFSERSLGAAHAQTGIGTASMFEVGAQLTREGERPIPLRVEEIGPSVARLVPARAPTPGLWHVSAGESSVDVTFGAMALPPVGRIPTLRSMQTQSGVSDGPIQASYTSTTAELEAPVSPPTWQGLVAYQATSPTTEIAIDARPLNGASATQIVYASPGRCGYAPPGQSPAPSGGLVRVALYDLFGRVSARSNQVRVR